VKRRRTFSLFSPAVAFAALGAAEIVLGAIRFDRAPPNVALGQILLGVLTLVLALLVYERYRRQRGETR